MTFGERVREPREKLGLTIDEWAKILDVTPNTLYRWESGKVVPQKSNQTKIKNMLSITRDEVAMEIIKEALEADDGLAAVSALFGLFYGYLKVAGVGYGSLKPMLKPGTTLYNAVINYSQKVKYENDF